MEYKFEDGDIKSLITYAVPFDMLSDIMHPNGEYVKIFDIDLKINGYDIDILPFLSKLYEAAENSAGRYAERILEQNSEEYKLKFDQVMKRIDMLDKLTSIVPEFYEQVENSVNKLWE